MASILPVTICNGATITTKLPTVISKTIKEKIPAPKPKPSTANKAATNRQKTPIPFANWGARLAKVLIGECPPSCAFCEV
ncbi:hypothetical protein GCM10007049_26840 [Echinicola pacifica]|uniref:Uncharacterized protein n=1 Tax=Echinicola pacifica TaxID=346377 RepID=A0A918Q2Z8_9BACT|nr:hypothetical protein GCM10007049_26840 [Echinicola pacifica]